MYNCPLIKSVFQFLVKHQVLVGLTYISNYTTTNLSVINIVPLPSSLSLIWTVVEGCSCLIPSVGGGKLLRTTIPRKFIFSITSLNTVVTPKLIIIIKKQRPEAVGNYAIYRFRLLVNRRHSNITTFLHEIQLTLVPRELTMLTIITKSLPWYKMHKYKQKHYAWLLEYLQSRVQRMEL
jgi:hypothetical protein